MIKSHNLSPIFDHIIKLKFKLTSRIPWKLNGL
jgi:hypothetical protein